MRRQQTPIAPGAIRLRAFSCAELTRMLPGQIDTPERRYCGIMIWGEGVYELRYESAYIKGYRPEPYVHKWSHIFPRPIQQPSESSPRRGCSSTCWKKATSRRRRRSRGCPAGRSEAAGERHFSGIAASSPSRRRR